MSKSKQTELVTDPPTHKEDPILNLQEAADQIGRSRQTIANWIAQGVMAAVQMPNGLFKVRQSTINHILRAQQKEVK